MAKKREFVSDSDVSRFISRKKFEIDEPDTPNRVQFTIYPTQEDLEQVKTLAKINDVNINSMFLRLIREALINPDYQSAINAYRRLFKN